VAQLSRNPCIRVGAALATGMFDTENSGFRRKHGRFRTGSSE
jgi:hypothetical protein